MANVVVVGAQWVTREGKIVDWLSEQADIVVRFQGGHNAGHTLVINGETYKLASAAVGRAAAFEAGRDRQWRGVRSAGLPHEVAKLKVKGVAISPENLRVAENVTLILPLHRERRRAARILQRGNGDRHHPPRHRPGL